MCWARAHPVGRGTPDRTVDEAFGTPDMAAATGDILTDVEHASLNHRGVAGVYTLPDAPAVYTQTYTPSSRSHPDLTSQPLTDQQGQAPDTILAVIAAPTIADGVGTLSVSGTNANLVNFRNAVEANIADVAAQVNALRADVVALKQLVNGVIDDLQTEGVMG